VGDVTETRTSRPYRSPRREAQARATRLDVLSAARRLFVDRGYAATTMSEVATAAGVTRKTVTTSFPTKRDLLMAVWDLALKGEDSQVPMAMQEWSMQVMAEPDPYRQLALVARNTRLIRDRAGDVMAALAAAAAADPEIATQQKQMTKEYYANQGRIIESLAGKGALRTDLTVAEANDLLFTLNSGHVYHDLVQLCGWSPERFEVWLTATLQQQLLAPRTSPGVHHGP
jgi:AcrR family transcriptional regulator